MVNSLSNSVLDLDKGYMKIEILWHLVPMISDELLM